MIVLGLDLSTRTGFAVFDDPKAAPRCGTFRLPKVYDPDDIGTRTLALRLWLRDMISKEGPDLIAFESPFIPMGPQKDRDTHDGKPTFVTTQQTLRLQISLAAEIETTAKEFKIECVEVATNSAKKALTGNGRAEKRDMVVAATQRGWAVADDHQADAAAVALVAMESVLG